MSCVGLPTPTSTACTVAPAIFANAESVDFPDWYALSIAAVTSAGYALTELEVATPWSAAKTSATGRETFGWLVACQPAIQIATSSSF